MRTRMSGGVGAGRAIRPATRLGILHCMAKNNRAHTNENAHRKQAPISKTPTMATNIAPSSATPLGRFHPDAAKANSAESALRPKCLSIR
jgi:hypothetical protein